MTDNNQSNGKAITPYVKLKSLALDGATVKRFADALGGSEKRALSFLSNVLTVASGNKKLLECQPEALLNECMKLAVMDLPINESLGFACILPFGGKPKHEIMKNGYIQLAHRTNEYAIINTGDVREGQKVTTDQLTGKVVIVGEYDKDNPITHYFNYFRKLNGLEHCLCWSIDELKAWGKRYAPSYTHPDSLWNKNPDAMYRAKVTKLNLKWYGQLSIYDESGDVEAALPPVANPLIIGNDRLTIPYDDEPLPEEPHNGEVVEGKLKDPEPAPEQSPAPQKSVAKPRGAKSEDERVAALLAANVVPNEAEAVSVLSKLNIAANVPVDDVVKLARGFYGWKDLQATDEQAIKYLKNGDYPK